MAILRIDGKLAFVKGIKEATHISLKEAKDTADEIIPSARGNNIATFDPKKFGWTIETLKKIVTRANSIHNNVTVLSYE